MKTTFKLFSILLVLFAFVSCSNDDDATTPEFTVTSISPESGPVGSEITITGANFPSDAAEVNLTFGGVNATINSITSTQIVTTVPAGASTGDVSVTVGGIAKNIPASFTVLDDLISGTVENLFAPQTGGQGQGPISGEFTKFSFETGAETDSETDWDIAFRATTIAVNGGVVTGTTDEPARNGNAGVTIQDALFSEVTSGQGLTYLQDGTGEFAITPSSGAGWYSYNPATFLVSPIPGKILVFRTHDGKYAKVEILSYYENAPADPDAFMDAARYYTFNYVYNPNQGETSLAGN